MSDEACAAGCRIPGAANGRTCGAHRADMLETIGAGDSCSFGITGGRDQIIPWRMPSATA
jgi:hypothetical protein